MHRRSFLVGSLATLTVASLTQDISHARTAIATPGSLRPHPRLLLDSFDDAEELISSDAAAASWYDKVKLDADSILDSPLPTYSIPPGNLLDTSRQTLRRVYSLGFALGIEGQEVYATRLWEELEAVCGFPDWNHDSHFLDTAEMAHAVAIAYDWFFDRWTEPQRETLRSALLQKAVLPGLDAYNGIGGSSSWPNVTNNWNIVCNAGVAIAALAIADSDPEVATEVLDEALESVPRGIGPYGPDGGYPEGVGAYWGYATKYLVLLCEALRTATEDDSGLPDLPGVSETGWFPIHLTGPTDQVFNYYDGSPTPPRPPEMFWFARTYQVPEFGWWGKTGADERGPSWLQTPTSLLWYDPSMVADPTQSGLALDAYFSDNCEVATMRSDWAPGESVYVGAKGGNNRVNHSDLDLGTFVLDALGVRWALELGSASYSLPGYFDAGANGRRWTYYRKRAEGQNTLVVNPGRHPDQPFDAYGAMMRRASSAVDAFAVADLAEASDDVTEWHRGWRLFDFRNQIVIQDELVAAEPSEAWWFMHTAADIEISTDGSTATLSYGSARLVARIVEPSNAVFYNADARPLWTSPDPSEQAPNDDVRKLAIRLRDITDTRIVVQFTPLNPGEDLPGVDQVIPLSQWEVDTSDYATLESVWVGDSALQSFSAASFNHHHDISFPADVVAYPTDARGRAIVGRRRAEDGSILIRVRAPQKAAAAYRLWPSLSIGPGNFPKPVLASSHDGNVPANVTDGNPDTRWSAEGSGQWIALDLGDSGAIDSVDIAWYLGDQRESYFDIEVADSDERTWRHVTSAVSSGTTADPERFHFPQLQARYVRILGHGNSLSDWNSITQIEVPGRSVRQDDHAPYLSSVEVGLDDVAVGQTVEMVVTGTMDDGGEADLSELEIEFVSTDPDVATVDPDGHVTGVSEGSTTLAAVVVTDDWRLVYGRIDIDVDDGLRPTFNSIADLYVRDGSHANTNFGTASELIVKTDQGENNGFNRVAFMSFAPEQATGSVQSVHLVVYADVIDSAGNQAEIDIFLAPDGIEESSTTWNTRPALGAHIAVQSITNVASWYEIDVTEALEHAVVDGDEVTLGVTQEIPPGTNGLATRIRSRETQNGPYLRVVLSDN